jgi:uncharacterized protein (TIGR03083 family)
MIDAVITDTTAEELLAREQRALQRVVALMGSTSPGTHVGDGSWTVRDVLAHLVTVAERYLARPPVLARTAREVDRINARDLTGLAGAGTSELLERLADAAAAYETVTAALPLDREFPFHGGVQLDIASLRCNWIAELLVHGHDVATATDAPWPIEDRDGLLVARLVLRVLPAYLRPGDARGVRVGIELAGGRPLTVLVDDGGVSVTYGLDRAAGVVRGAPAPFALLLYARTDLTGAELAGVEVIGDRDAVDRLLGALERP